jgi:hypothetical protein
MRGPGIEDKSLYNALREKEDYVRQTQMLSLIRSNFEFKLTYFKIFQKAKLETLFSTMIPKKMRKSRKLPKK